MRSSSLLNVDRADFWSPGTASVLRGVVIRIADHTCPLVAADTNVLSAVALDHPGVRAGFFRLFSGYVTCFSPYSLLEISESPAACSAFLDFFGGLPYALLKDEAMLFADEKSLHPEVAWIDPAVVGFSLPSASAPTGLATALESIFPETVMREREVGWPALRSELMVRWASLEPRFSPRGERYAPSDGVSFVNEATVRYVRSRDPRWAHEQDRAGVRINPRTFKSVRMTLWSIFFRRDWAEPPKDDKQDLFDALISAAAPYVDAVATDNFQVDIYRKVQKLEPSLLRLTAYTLSDIVAAARA